MISLLKNIRRAVSGIGRLSFIMYSVSRINCINWGSQFTYSSPVSGCRTSSDACSPKNMKYEKIIFCFQKINNTSIWTTSLTRHLFPTMELSMALVFLLEGVLTFRVTIHSSNNVLGRQTMVCNVNFSSWEHCSHPVTRSKAGSSTYHLAMELKKIWKTKKKKDGDLFSVAATKVVSFACTEYLSNCAPTPPLTQH